MYVRGGNLWKNTKKKERKHAFDQEIKIQEKTITIKKKEGMFWGNVNYNQLIKHLASFFTYIQFGPIHEWQTISSSGWQ